MTALRLARHTTGRRLVALFQGSYHGHFDGVLAQLGADGNAVPMAGGTPAGMTDDIVLLDYGDEEAAHGRVDKEFGRIVAIELLRCFAQGNVVEDDQIGRAHV